MKYKALLSLGVLAIAALPGCGKAPLAKDQAGIEAGVTQLIENWSQAGVEGRWGDLKALYADEPGFVWIEQGRVAYPDHAAVVAGVDQAAGMGAAIESKVFDISVAPLSPDAAAFHARSTLSLKTEEFGFEFDGVFSGVAVKRDGAWRFLHGHLSAPAQAAVAQRAE